MFFCLLMLLRERRVWGEMGCIWLGLCESGFRTPSERAKEECSTGQGAKDIGFLGVGKCVSCAREVVRLV